MTGPSRHAEELRGLIEKQYSPSAAMRRLSLLALKQADEEAARSGLSDDDALNLLYDAVNLVSATQRSFHTSLWKPEGDEGARLWEHQSLDNAFMEGRLAVCNIGVNTDQLNEIACDLIWKRWLRLDELEWVIVDALVFREVFEFGEALKQGFGPRDRANFAEGRLSPGMFSQGWAYFAAEGNPRNMVLKRLQVSIALWILRWGSLAAAIWGGWRFVHSPFYRGLSEVPAFGLLGGAFLLLVWSVVISPVRRHFKRRALRRNQRKQTDLLRDMWSAYKILEPRGPLSPYQIRAALLSSQDKGAVWPSAAFSLLDRAAMRDPPVWNF